MTAQFLKIAALCSAVTGAAFAVAWHADQARAAAASANMKTYMIDVVMPAMQPIWDGSYADKVTDADWKAMQDNAGKLQATVATIRSGGSVPGEQVRAKDAKWQSWTKKMDDEVKVAKAAADKKDQMALAMAGDNLVEICGGCHTDFDPTAGKY
jgi:hypothetical protein